MTKNKKNKKTNKDISLDQLEQNANDDLQNGRFRKAKEAFKELCCHNREKYLPGLIKSYNGLAKQMIENGQTSEAQTVISHIKALSPDFDNSTLEMKINIKKADSETAVEEYVKYFSSIRDDLNETENLKAADMMVTAFRDFPFLAENCPELNSDLCVIKHALEYVSNEKFNYALDVLRKINRKSMFSHWKLFIKGLIAFYENDDLKAKNAFEMLPDKTVLHQAANPFLLIMDNRYLQKLNEKVSATTSKMACILTGLSGYSEIVSRADYLWRVGRYRDSFILVCDKYPGFPSEGTGLTALLTRFFYNAPFNLSSSAAEKFVNYMHPSVEDASKKNDLKSMLAFRLVSIYYERSSDDHFIVDMWEKFLAIYKGIHGENKKINALVYARLGAIFARVAKKPDYLFPLFFRNVDQLQNTKLAVKFFEKSIACNDKDKDVYINLLKVYEYTEENSKVNKLLDLMIQQFPDDKEILVSAGTACVHRKVFSKAVKYLEQALKLDHLDSKTKEALIIAYLQMAKSNFMKNKVIVGRDVYRRVLEIELPGSSCFNFGHAYIYARWAGLEFTYGSDEVGNKVWQTAQSLNVSRFSLLYFALLIFKSYNAPLPVIKNLENDVEIEFSQKTNAETVLQLMKVIEYISQTGNFSWLYFEKERVKSFSLKAAKNVNDNFSRETVKDIVRLVFSDRENYRFKHHYIVAHVYIKKMLVKDKNDPQFLFYEYILKKNKFESEPGERTLVFLKKILTFADERNDHVLINDINREIAEIEGMVNNPFFKEMGNKNDDWDVNGDIDAIFDQNHLEELNKIFSVPAEDDKKSSKSKGKSKGEPQHAKNKEQDSGKKPKHRQIELF